LGWDLRVARTVRARADGSVGVEAVIWRCR
jgi:hypothetical protein